MDLPLPDLDATLQRAASLAAEWLRACEDRAMAVARPLPPKALREELALSLPREGRPMGELLDDVERMLGRCVRTGHPRFFNQLFGGYDVAGILGEWMTALVNTSMYTFEVAPVATLLELALLARMNALVGFGDGDGVFAPGGSISNLTALLVARHRAFPHVKHEGWRPDDRPVLFTSAEAHYSIRRAASVMGIGTGAVREIEVDEDGAMRPDALERAVEAARAEGHRPFAVVATSGTTVAGAFDPLADVAEVAARHGSWLHVDASFGGGVLFSAKHRALVAGIERADSVAWNPHKMMGVPLSCSATLVREKGWLESTNGMHADYLFHGAAAESIDLGDRSLQCGRRVDALKLWLSWQARGDAGYGRRIDRLFELAARFRALVEEREGFSLARVPQGTNVCFHYLPPSARAAMGEARRRLLEEHTVRIRARLTAEGGFLINYASLDGVATFRIVLNNPRADEGDLVALLDEIRRIGDA